jgi:ankyrin repeat protein/serine/threonine protein kinase
MERMNVWADLAEARGLTLLHLAAEEGNTAMCSVVLEVYQVSYPDFADAVNGKDSRGKNAAAFAVGNLATLQRVVGAGADICNIDNEGMSSLHWVARMGSADSCRYLIDLYRELGSLQQMLASRDSKDSTPALIATLNNRQEVVKLLIEAGADPKSVDKNQLSMLHVAATHGHGTVCRYLVDLYRSTGTLKEMLESRSNDNDTPALLAAYHNHLEVLRLLVDAGADIRAVDSNEWSMLHAAARQGHGAVCEYLIDRHRANGELQDILACRNSAGKTTALLAAAWGQLPVLKLLVDTGADVRAMDTDQWSMLHLAAVKGNAPLCEYLIELYRSRGALRGMLESRTKNNDTPAMLATFHNHIEVVRLLVDAGTDMRAVDNNAWSMLHMVARQGHGLVCQYLIELYRSLGTLEEILESKSAGHDTPALLAAFNGHVEVVRLLVDAGADIRAVDNNDWSMLHMAARQGRSSVCQYLIAIYRSTGTLRAILESKSKGHDTPALLAAFNGHIEILRLLVDAGADTRAVDNNEWSMLHMAARQGDSATCQYLIEIYRSTGILKEMLEFQSKDRNTPALLATYYNHLQVLRVLVEAGADTRAVDCNAWSVLHKAARLGYGAVCQYLIELHRSTDTLKDVLESKTEGCDTPALLAAFNGHVEVLRLLVEAGADIRAVDNNEWSMLHMAARQGHDAVCEYLVGVYRSIGTLDEMLESRSKDKDTPALLAAYHNHLEVLRLLVDAGADIRAADSNEWTMLHAAARQGHGAVCEYLIDRHRANGELQDSLACRNSTGNTAAWLAAAGGQVSVLKLLVESGADIRAVDGNQWSMLHLAARHGQGAVCRYLIELYRSAGTLESMLDSRSKENDTPALLAAFHNHVEVVGLLVGAGADTRAVDDNEWSLLHMAARQGHHDVCQYLLELYRSRGALKKMLESESKSHDTPAMLAAFYNHVEVLRLLVDAGVDLRAVDNNEWSMLHMAARQGHDSVCQYLIELYRSTGMLKEVLESKSKSHDTPTMLAAYNNHVETVRLLVGAGADTSAVDNNGWSILHMAARQGHGTVCQYLIELCRSTGTLKDMLESRSKSYDTPALLAAYNNRPEVLRLLVDAGADITAVDDQQWSMLHMAARQGHGSVCEYVLECHRANGELQEMLASRNSAGNTAALMAAVWGHLSILKLLVDNGADARAVDADKWSMLHQAAKNGNASICEYLIELYADRGVLPEMLASRNKGHDTPALVAAYNNQVEVLRLLVDAGADTRAVDENEWSMLHMAARQGHDAVCQYLLELYRSRGALKEMLESGSKTQDTPALVAAFNGHVEVLRLLVDAGANINVVDHKRWSMLHMAVGRGHELMCQYLVDLYHKNGELNSALASQIEYGNTPASIAVISNHLGVLKLLISAGADPAVVDITMWSLLHKAADMGHEAICRYLIDIFSACGRLPEMMSLPTIVGYTALALAIKSGRHDVIKLLAEFSTDMQALTKDGRTLLHIAAEAGISTLVSFLADKGVDVNIADEGGLTALHLALSSNHLDTAFELLRLNPDLNKADKHCQTPLYVAAMMGFDDIIEPMLAQSANLEIVTVDKLSPIQIAAIKNNASIVRRLLRCGARVNISFESTYTACPSNRPLIRLLYMLLCSQESDDIECLRSISLNTTDHSILHQLCIDMGIDLRATFPNPKPSRIIQVLGGIINANCRFPYHRALRQLIHRSNDSEFVDLIRENPHAISDVDDFGSTLLSLAISIGSSANVVDELLQLTLATKLDCRFLAPIEIQRRPGDHNTFTSVRLSNVVIRDAKVYTEITVRTVGIIQLGICAVGWQPDANTSLGVGDSLDSIAFDSSRNCCYDNGNCVSHKSIPAWKIGTVVGICIDAISRQLELLVDGVHVNLPTTISFANFGSKGIMLACSFDANQGCQINFGEVPSCPLKYHPADYISLFDYATASNVAFIPSLQIFNRANLAWDHVVPGENCIVSKYYYDFTRALRSTDDFVASCACRVLAQNSSRVREIANDLNEEGQRAIDIASRPCRQMLRDMLYFLGRYDLDSTKPEYESNSSIVFLARINNEHVAIKLLRDRGSFEQELRSRQKLDASYVIPVTECYNGDENEQFLEEVRRRNYPDYRYGIIMPAARRNLLQILGAENLDFKATEIRRLFEDLVRCVQHLHSKGFIHGDIKPLNIMRNREDRLILIDLDASCPMGSAEMRKCSLAYAPPESLMWDDSIHEFVPRTSCDKLPLSAHSSFDVWSLGAVLYQMCTGYFLFPSSHDDIDQHQRKLLHHWETGLKREKLDKITNLQARNLLSRMLTKEADARPSLASILLHPYVSNVSSKRMVDEPPAVDVFISYRVDADKDCSDKLYALLTQPQRRLNVWRDVQCLKDGVDFEEGFSDGLAQSKIFVCLISANAVANRSTGRGFHTLQADSRCDNVLLEHLLALELKQLNMISRIFPIFIGARTTDEKNCCAPFDWSSLRNMPDVCVQSVQDKVAKHLERLGLGSPYFPCLTVKEVVDQITINNGRVLAGDIDEQLAMIADRISRLNQEVNSEYGGVEVSPTESAEKVNQSVSFQPDDPNERHTGRNLEMETMQNQILSLQSEVRALDAENILLRNRLKALENQQQCDNEKPNWVDLCN